MTMGEFRTLTKDVEDDAEIEVYYHYGKNTIIKLIDHVATKVLEGFVYIHVDELSKIQMEELKDDSERIDSVTQEV